MTDKIKIVYFITSLESGGTERQLGLLLEALPSEQYEKHIVCLSGLGPLESRFRHHVTSITDLKYRRLRHNGRFVWHNIPSSITSVIRLVAAIRKSRPDILHTLIPVCNVMGAIAGKLAKVPVLVCSRLSLGNYRDNNKFFARMEDQTDRAFTLIHCKSQGIRDDIILREPVDPDRVKVIYNGIDVSAYELAIDKEPLRVSLGLKLGWPVVGMVANLKPYKGHSDLINAMPAILQKHPDTRFLFIGRDDGILTKLVALADSLNLKQHIIFAGERNDVPKLLQLMTLLVSASHEEGFSNTILEAMASALPVVATSVGGNVEQVIDGVTGYLVPPSAPDELSNAVIQLLNNPVNAQKMGRHGNVRVARDFSYKAVTDQMMAFYQEAIELESNG